MIGKRLFSAVSLAAVLLPASALAGMPVTDPMSYTYYVQQLKKMGEQVNQAADQVNKLGEINQQIQSMEGQLKGTYNRAVGVLDDLKKAKEQVEGVPGTIAQTGRDFADEAKELKEGKGAGKSVYKDARAALDALFKDPRKKDGKEGKDAAKDKAERDRQYQARQAALRDSIVTADGLLQQMPEAFANIEKLAKQIDTTQNVKDATDLTNRILIEMLKTLTQMLAVDSRLTQAQGLLNYKGVSEETTTQRMETIKETEKAIEEDKFFRDLATKHGGAGNEVAQAKKAVLGGWTAN